MLRSYALDLNGHPCGRLKPGAEVSVNVMPGRHVLQARIDWTGSPRHEIKVKRESVVRVCVEPTGWPWELWRAFSRTHYLRLTVEQLPTAV